jgi:tetratricopeptide (TPR) repeat protein
MREALQHALHLRFAQALETAARLEKQEQATLESQLTRGMIAYFQARWQTPQASSTRQTAQKYLATVVEQGRQQLAQSPEAPWLKLVLGTAVAFEALRQQQRAAWPNLQHVALGHAWLQQALMAHETMTDAHLGLGILAFTSANLPTLLRPFLGSRGPQSHAEAIHHLRRAAEAGHFSQEVARTFLAHLYAVEKRYQDAIALGQTLQDIFPDNGYYTLLTGRSQCAQGQYADCATTLGKLTAGPPDTPAPMHPDERFDLYYWWARALHETEQYALAFEAFRQAINQDPQAVKDESLWAKYYLATLYERRGETKTAQQLYRTLLRGRNVENLHRQATQRLTRLQ